MKLSGEQLVLDTNVLVHWLRGGGAGQKLRADYELGSRRPRPIVPVVVKGEIRSLAIQLGWGDAKSSAMEELLRQLPIADISSDEVVLEYARIDGASRLLGRKMGKNDLWIAAVALVQGAVILTTDKDFDHLHPAVVRVEWVDPQILLAPTT